MSIRQEKPPSLPGMVFASIFAVFLGLGLGVGSLAVQQPTVVKEMPVDGLLDRKANYLILGRTGGRGSSFRAKSRLIADRQPGTYTFDEVELNSWALVELSTPPLPDTGAIGLVVTPATPNFRIVGDQIQIAITLSLSVGGFKQELTYETVGRFELRDGKSVFVPAESVLGTARVPAPVSGLLEGALVNLYRGREPLRGYFEAWPAVESISLAQDEIAVNLRP